MIRSCPDCLVCNCVLTPEQKWPQFDQPFVPVDQEYIDTLLRVLRDAGQIQGVQLRLF